MRNGQNSGEPSEHVFMDVAAALGGMLAAGAILGISRTALVQYVHHGGRPTKRRRVRILHALAGRV